MESLRQGLHREAAIAETESRLESARAERDDAKARQVALEIENANLRREVSFARERQGASGLLTGPIDFSLLREAIDTRVAAAN